MSTTYKAIVNRAKDFIDQHCCEDLSLDQIAAHVFMSPFHFQRIFKQETGDTPKEYMTRIRLDSAIIKLRLLPEKPLFEVAMECGFSSQSTFARAFRQRYGMSASECRSLSVPEIITLCEPNFQEMILKQIDKSYKPKEKQKFLASVRIVRLEPINVIYVPTTMKSEKHIADEFQTFAHRASANDIQFSDAEYYGLMNDHPMHTPIEKCRYKVCIRIPVDVEVPSKFHKMKIEGGKHAVFRIRGNIDSMVQHSILIGNSWLPSSHYKWSGFPWFEKFGTLPNRNSYSTVDREFYIPIAPV